MNTIGNNSLYHNEKPNVMKVLTCCHQSRFGCVQYSLQELSSLHHIKDAHGKRHTILQVKHVLVSCQ